VHAVAPNSRSASIALSIIDRYLFVLLQATWLIHRRPSSASLD
jgi:hypothetical protein